MKALLTALVLTIAACLLSAPAQAQQAPNQQVTIFPAAVQTATTVNSNDQQNASWKGLHLVVNVSAFTSGTYTVNLQGKDAFGNYYTILSSTALAATGVVVLKVYPGETVAANLSASDFLPAVWRVQLVGATTPNMTISVDANLSY
jgi:hypothetical protein